MTLVLDEHSFIDHLRSRRVLREIGQEHKEMACGGAGLIFCSDCDQSFDKLTHLFEEVNSRLQPWGINGGALVVDPMNPINREFSFAEMLAEQFGQVRVKKGLAALFVEGHQNCLIQRFCEMSLLDAVRSTIGAARFLAVRFPMTHIVPLFTVSRPDTALRTYVVSKSAFAALPGGH